MSTSFPFATSMPPPQRSAGTFSASFGQGSASYASRVHGFETDQLAQYRGPLAATPTTVDPNRYAAASSFTCPVDRGVAIPDVYVNLRGGPGGVTGPPLAACAAPFSAARTESACLANNLSRSEEPCASRVAKSGSYVDCVDYVWLDAAKGQFGLDPAGRRVSGCFTTLIGQCCGTDREPNASVSACAGPRQPPGASHCYPGGGGGATPPGPPTPPTPPAPSGDRARAQYPAFAWIFPPAGPQGRR